jgi:cytochrome P450
LKAIDHIAAAARSCVAERRAKADQDDSSARRDLLQQLLGIVQEKGEKVDFGIGEVEYEAYVALFAGSDTTAIAMRACLYFLMKNPAVYRQVQKEIDDAVEAGQLHFPVKYAEAIQLPLLCASIKESMRLHPSVGLTMPRIVPEGGLDLCGQHIPAGYRVGMNAAVVGYNEEIYGPDAGEFRPARWLEGDAAQMEKHLLVFGSGTRTCIGKNVGVTLLQQGPVSNSIPDLTERAP